MTSITVDTVWLNLVSDPSDYQSFPLMSALTVTPLVTGSVRQLAGGRKRLVKQAGIQRQIDVNLPSCDRTQIAWLEDHIGELMCVRDDRSRKHFAAYLSLPVSEQQGDLVDKPADVAVQLFEITHEEVV